MANQAIQEDKNYLTEHFLSRSFFFPIHYLISKIELELTLPIPILIKRA